MVHAVPSSLSAAPRGWLRARRGPLWALASLTLAAGVAGAGLGTFLRFDLPDVRTLEDYRPAVGTRLFAADGAVAWTFAQQQRIELAAAEIPPLFQQALLASEDAGFFSHTGVDPKGIARAAWRDVTQLSLAQGASTLTQQLARNLFLHPDKTFRRKVQEALLALEIERQYTKQEILRFYCNQIYMGHGRYGLEAAARLYFAKPARELTLPEAATLAGLIQRPEALTPLRHPERSLNRRNWVLRRMAAVGYLTAEQAREAQAAPLVTAPPRAEEAAAPYFVEDVRRWLQERFGATNLYTAGLSVRSTLDPELQRIANVWVDRGLRQLDKRRGFRGPAGRVPPGSDPRTFQPESWKVAPRVPGIHDGVVVAVDARGAHVRVGPWSGTLDARAIAWTGRADPRKLVRPGDIVRVHLLAAGAGGAGDVELELEQEPEVQAALIALDPATGAVRAVVGGRDFEQSEFNRATQARRQTGSAFKPFVFAAALTAGATLADTLVDEPTVFVDPQNPEPYQPENYSEGYYGRITLRAALERSANIASVKLLERIGPRAVIDTARRLGLRADLQPYPSLALGAFETTLLDLTSAYATFGNQGVRVEPHWIEEVTDRQGTVLYRARPEVSDSVPPQIAYLMNRVLAGVISDGTGQAAADLGLPLAGKTGTTDDCTDAWFVGYSPRLAVGVWVGFDGRRSLGRRETGAVAALPIWRGVMQEYFAGRESPAFAVPPGVTHVGIDRRTGLRSSSQSGCDDAFEEAFLEGTEPTVVCSPSAHDRLRLPYAFQHYDLDESGALLVPRAELALLLDANPSVSAPAGGPELVARLPDGPVALPLRLTDAGPDDPFDAAGRAGRDGHPARSMLVSPEGALARRD